MLENLSDKTQVMWAANNIVDQSIYLSLKVFQDLTHCFFDVSDKIRGIVPSDLPEFKIVFEVVRQAIPDGLVHFFEQ